MPRGEPTRVVRLPAWLLDHLERDLTGDETLPALITRRLAPRQARPGVRSALTGASGRCTCASPVLSKHVTSLCTTCKLMR